MGMKMTIEQAKEILKAYDFAFTGHTGSLKDAIDTVLPIVEKYQRVQAIVEAWEADTDIDSYDAMVDIEEVMKDENLNYKATV